MSATGNVFEQLAEETRERLALKPCPFCGGTNLYVGTSGAERSVTCGAWGKNGCGAQAKVFYATEAELAGAWNRRVCGSLGEDPEAAVRELLSLARVLGKLDPETLDSYEETTCFFCRGERYGVPGDPSVLHDERCLWVSARSLLAKYDTEPNDAAR